MTVSELAERTRFAIYSRLAADGAEVGVRQQRRSMIFAFTDATEVRSKDASQATIVSTTTSGTALSNRRVWMQEDLDVRVGVQLPDDSREARDNPADEEVGKSGVEQRANVHRKMLISILYPAGSTPQQQREGRLEDGLRDPVDLPAGMVVSPPLVAGHRPGLLSARWICRYSSRPDVATMIPECGPFQ